MTSSASGSKARRAAVIAVDLIGPRELGWTARPLEEGMADTVASLRSR